jgi:hypothetical protein
LGSRVNLTDDGTLVVQRYDKPVDLGEAIQGKTFKGLHIYGKPNNLKLLSSLTHLVELRLQSTGHVDFEPINDLTKLEKLSYFSGSLKELDLTFLRDILRELDLGRHKSLTDLRPIEVCRRLEVLRLSHLPKITHHASLASFRSLRRLELINLGTWPSLRDLKGAANLEWLCVGRTKIDDGCWEPLLQLGKLRFVGGMVDAFGRSAADELKVKRPKVRVVG